MAKFIEIRALDHKVATDEDVAEWLQDIENTINDLIAKELEKLHARKYDTGRKAAFD
jgi:hypothetical protein